MGPRLAIFIPKAVSEKSCCKGDLDKQFRNVIARMHSPHLIIFEFPVSLCLVHTCAHVCVCVYIQSLFKHLFKAFFAHFESCF